MEELKTKNESLQNEINVNLQKQLNETREQFQKQINDSVKQSVRNFQMKILLKIFDLDWIWQSFWTTNFGNEWKGKDFLFLLSIQCFNNCNSI